MTVEFISLINVWESSELHPRPGGAPDAGDATLAVYYVGLGAGKPNHVGKAGMGAALSGGGLSILKFQQDSDAGILVDQSYSK